MADRIALMRAGRIVQLGTPASLYYQPSEAFVASFFGEINSLEGIVEAGEVATPFGTVAADGLPDGAAVQRSEEHTSELQSLMRISYAVFCLKKKKKQYDVHNN